MGSDKEIENTTQVQGKVFKKWDMLSGTWEILKMKGKWSR